MRWLIFAIFVYLAFALNIGLRTMPIWSIHTTVGPVSPDLVLMLAIYFGLWAPPRTAAWAMLILGLLVDLTTLHYTAAGMNPALSGPQVVAIVGPNALGYLVGAYAVVQFRGLLYRESAVSVAIMVFVVGIMVTLVMLLLLTLRGIPWLVGEPITNWSASDQLVYHLEILLYTAVVAAPLSRLLGRVRGLWGLESAKSHGFRR